MPPLRPEFAASLRDARLDRRITDREWKDLLEPHLRGTPAKATEEAREVVRLLTDGFEVEPGAESSMREFLASRGYSVPSGPVFGAESRIVASNVTELDAEFERLSSAAGVMSSTITVAVLDVAFDVDHPALQGKLWVNAREIPGNGIDDDGNGYTDDRHGFDFLGKDGDLARKGSVHGNWVASLAGRGTEQIKLLLGDAADSPEAREWSPDNIVHAIDYAAANGARVINVSQRIDYREATRAVIERHPNILFVVSSGNESVRLGARPPQMVQDLSLPNLAVVAASDEYGRPATNEGRSFSNVGREAVTHAAHGDDVQGAGLPGRYRSEDGTSAAAPNLSSVAAKCLLLDPQLTPAQVKRLLDVTGIKSIEWSDLVASKGPIDPQAAMRLAALTGLVRRGSSVEQAADRLGLVGPERERLVRWVPEFVTAPPPPPTPAPSWPANPQPDAFLELLESLSAGLYGPNR